MRKGVSADGRFPVPLRRTVPVEADMLAELESLKGTYGAMNESLREWMLRGFKELELRTQQAPSSGGDVVSALAAVAQELNNSVAISQHFLSLYIQAKEAVAQATTKPRTPSVRPAPSPEVAPSAPKASGEGARPTHNWSHLKGLVGGDT